MQGRPAPCFGVDAQSRMADLRTISLRSTAARLNGRELPTDAGLDDENGSPA